MSYTILLVNSEGEIRQTIKPADPSHYNLESVDANGLMYLLAPSDDIDIDNTWYNNGNWEARIARPGNNYNWINAAWVFDSDGLDSEILSSVRSKLRDSDWTQLDDTPADRGLWAAYRAQLRALTRGSASHMNEIAWPTPPS